MGWPSYTTTEVLQRLLRSIRSRRISSERHFSTSTLWRLLPLELILMIIAEIGPFNYQDMASLLQTCHAMRCIVEASLYTHIRITLKRDYKQRIFNLWRTIYDRPDLARRIIIFNIPILYPFPYWVPRAEKGPFSLLHRIQNSKTKRNNRLLEDAITECFPHLCNVTSLTIRDSDLLRMSLNPLAKEALSAVALPCLNTLAVYGRTLAPDHHQAACCSQFVTIIRLQPLLEHILLFYVGTGWNLQQRILLTDLPRLSTLVSGVNEAAVLVPGRSITSLSLIGTWSSRSDTALTALAPSACLLGKLTLDLGRSSWLLVPVIHMVATHMPDITCLVVVASHHHDMPLVSNGFDISRAKVGHSSLCIC
ncbi:hypothetical protein FRB94_009868 [Tulasnella sp. JGI-2019a]|nr:hypothetical protein FRB94_009868 [Tulasnella sp. JGI-2019a]KAG9029843.1 hypothetical protein FRB95_004795 [Tulasnella sp. JGI-2019a]